MSYSRTVSYTFGAAFLAAGILGFVPNPIVSRDGIFVADTMHNLLHIVVGIAFLSGAALGVSLRTLQLLGAVGIALAIAGFITRGNTLLGFIEINEADRWLHAGLAALIVATAALLSRFESRSA